MGAVAREDMGALGGRVTEHQAMSMPGPRCAQQSCGLKTEAGRWQSDQQAASSRLSRAELNSKTAPPSSGRIFGAIPAISERMSFSSMQLCRNSAILAKGVARLERRVSSRTMPSFCKLSSGWASARSRISDSRQVLASSRAAGCWRICSSRTSWLGI